MELALPGRLEEIPEELGYCLMALRDAARQQPSRGTKPSSSASAVKTRRTPAQ